MTSATVTGPRCHSPRASCRDKSAHCAQQAKALKILSRRCLKYFLPAGASIDRLRSNYIPQQKRHCAQQAKVSENDLAKASPDKRGSQGVLNTWKMSPWGVHTMSTTSLRTSDSFILLTSRPVWGKATLRHMFLNPCT